MSCKNYRLIEMQNDSLGAVAVNGLMPLGRVTRRIATCTGSGVPFQVTNSGADTVQLTSKGFYNVLYSASVNVGAAGNVTLSLLVNGQNVHSVTATAAGAGSVNLTLSKCVKVCDNCASMSQNCPLDIQVQLSGTAITGGSANIRIDSCVNG